MGNKKTPNVDETMLKLSLADVTCSVLLNV